MIFNLAEILKFLTLPSVARRSEGAGSSLMRCISRAIKDRPYD